MRSRSSRHVVEKHWSYLDRCYAEHLLLCSGPQGSGTGGALVLFGSDEGRARALMDADSVIAGGHATYELRPFRATRAHDSALIERD